jgi:hypothetical protein
MDSDWAEKDADELLILLSMVQGDDNRRALIAAKLREIESGGALRGARQVAGGIKTAMAGAQP